MIGLILESLLFILITKNYIINGDTPLALPPNYKYCEWELNKENAPHNNISTNCTSLVIFVQNGTQFSWDEIDKAELPNLKNITIVLPSRNNFQAKEFEWKKLLFFIKKTKDDKKGVKVSSYFSFEDQQNNSLYFGRSLKLEGELAIDSIDAHPVLDAFRDEEIHVKILEITNSTLEDSEEFIPPKGVVRLYLNKVQVRNFSGLIKNFSSLQNITLKHNVETIDVSAMLSASKNISSIRIKNNNLTLTDPTRPSESVELLYIRNCPLDSSFKENAWRVMPNVTEFLLEFNTEDNVELGDIGIVPFQQLRTLYLLTNSSLTFNKNPTQIWNSMTSFYLEGRIEFNSNGTDVAWNGFPNLKQLTVHDLHRTTKMNEGFLTGVLRSLRNIETIGLEYFDLLPEMKYNGIFRLYYYNLPQETGNKAMKSHLLDTDPYKCAGVFKNGKLEITGNNMNGQPSQNNNSCTELEIKNTNGTNLNWEEVQLQMTFLIKLKSFSLYLTSTDEFNSSEFQWKSFLTTRKQGLSLYLYVNGMKVFQFTLYNNLDEDLQFWNTIDPNPILKTALDLDLQINFLTISNNNIDDREFIYTGVSRVISLTLENTHVRNMSNFLQKFNSLTHLTLKNFGGVDICEDILEATKKLIYLEITHSNLSCGLDKTAVTFPSDSLIYLKLNDCVLESLFLENSSKFMPYLTVLELSSILLKIDISDTLHFNQLFRIEITNSSLTFTKPMIQQFSDLVVLKLINCVFDSNFTDRAWSTFSNLKHLTVESRLGGIKPTQDFLEGVLAKLPNIRTIRLDPFNYTLSIETMGEFSVIYAN